MRETDPIIAALADPVDPGILQDPSAWALIRETSEARGVAQLIAYRARLHVPASERDWCDEVLRRSWTAFNRNVRDLTHTLGILESANIPAACLKGPALALRFYQPPFVRKPSIDLDILVRDSDLETAVDAFRKEGYRIYWPLKESRTRSYHVRMVHNARLNVELHFRLGRRPFGIEGDDLMERSGARDLGSGLRVRVLAPADELFHLALHNAHHNFMSLFHFVEFKRIWTASLPETRARTVELAIRHHSIAAFAMTDVAFRSVWGEPFLDPAVQLPKTWLGGGMNRRFFERFSSFSKDYAWTAAAQRRWADFQLTDRPVDALRLAGNLVELVLLRAARAMRKQRGSSRAT